MALFLQPKKEWKSLGPCLILLWIPFTLQPEWFARFVGTVILMGLGIALIGKLRTRMLYSDICKASFWNEKIKLSNEALEELLFWKHCFGQFNGRPIGLFHQMLQL